MRLIRLWKPYHVLTRFTDAQGRPTLADFVDMPGVYAAGRLDYDSEGLLLLTDAGWLNARLTQPQYQHPRTYWALIEGRHAGDIPDQAALDRLRTGIPLSDTPGRVRLTLPAQARVLAEVPHVGGVPLSERTEPPIEPYRRARAVWLEMTLIEGRNRQVRRMTAAIGYPTLRLVRARIGTGDAAVSLEGLQPGIWQEVSPAAVQALAKMLR